MIYLLALFVIPLAVWRVANLLSDTGQSGPFEILSKIRSYFGVKFDEQSQPYAKPGSMGDMLICTYCNSIWIGILFTVGLVLNTELTTIFSLPFALSAIAILIQEWLDGRKA